jgi:hypothetical protein
MAMPRCGSLASRGKPLAAIVPSTTQLLLPSASVMVPSRLWATSAPRNSAGESCGTLALVAAASAPSLGVASPMPEAVLPALEISGSATPKWSISVGFATG